MPAGRSARRGGRLGYSSCAPRELTKERACPLRTVPSGGSSRSRASCSTPCSTATCRRSTTRSRSRCRRRPHRSSPRCSSTSATTACARSPWTPPTASRAARTSTTPARSITVPVGEATLGRIFNVLGETIDKGDDAAIDAAPRWPIHREPPAFDDALADGRDLRDRHQGRRPAGPVREGRQDRPVRRRRRGQDGAHPGADQQHRHAARRPLGVRRRGRAHARGQRPLARDDGVRRHRQDRAGLRPDERAAGRAPARRPDRPDDGRVLPRRGRPGRAALHRQHLPLRAGGLRGVGAARPHAQRRGLPADAGHRDGRAAGAHHLDHARARSPRCRPSTCLPTTSPTRPRPPPSPTSTRRRCSRARSRRRASTRPSTRSTRPRASCSRASSATSTTTWRTRVQQRAAALQGPAGHHRDPRHGRALRRGQARSCSAPARSSASCRSRSSWPRSSPAAPGKYVQLEDTIRSFREILEGKHDDLPEQAFYLQGDDVRDVLAAAEELAAGAQRMSAERARAAPRRAGHARGPGLRRRGAHGRRPGQGGRARRPAAPRAAGGAARAGRDARAHADDEWISLRHRRRLLQGPARPGLGAGLERVRSDVDRRRAGAQRPRRRPAPPRRGRGRREEADAPPAPSATSPTPRTASRSPVAP